MHHATLCLIVKDKKILLGRKKRGFGKDKFNGFGGKIKEDETIEEAAARELYEESNIIVQKDFIKKMAELKFTFPHAKEKKWDQIVHVFLIEDWENEPEESKEMTCEWFEMDSILYHKMWQDDRHWLPLILSGKKIKGSFTFDNDNETITEKEISEVESF